MIITYDHAVKLLKEFEGALYMEGHPVRHYIIDYTPEANSGEFLKVITVDIKGNTYCTFFNIEHNKNPLIIEEELILFDSPEHEVSFQLYKQVDPVSLIN